MIQASIVRRLQLSVISSVLLAVALPTGSAAASALVDQSLQGFGRSEGVQKAKILGLLTVTPSGVPAPRRYDRVGVVNYLKYTANQNWKQVADYLYAAHLNAQDVANIRVFGINASFTADVTPAGLRALANAPGVTKIYANRPISWNKPAHGARDRGRRPMLDGAPAAFPYDYKDTELDKLIGERSPINGAGVVLGQVDTGVDGTHPALQGKILKFYNVHTKKVEAPTDSDEHGTHTAGTMVGGDWSGNPIGMAPGAKLISTGPLNDFSEMVDAMQFMLDPDGDSSTKDSPRAVNNSWNCDGAPDVEVFYRAISAWDAAGILPVFSAGNSGPNPGSITHPHEHPLAFAIAATGADGKVTSYSSRGPGMFNGKPTQKPDLAAPGDKIRSSIPGGGYEEMSGTSMATPHVTGTTALLFQANPALTPQQVRAILVGSATAVDANGNPIRTAAWNASYGMGKLDIYRAVKLATQARTARAGLREFTFSGFTTPDDIDVGAINALDGGTIENVFDYPETAQIGHGWVTLD